MQDQFVDGCPWCTPTKSVRKPTSQYAVELNNILTLRPASLLWTFISPSGVRWSSPESTKSLLKRAPNLMSSEQPPHFQRPPLSLFRTNSSQRHSPSSPLLHARVTLYATPALDIAYTYAFSRLPRKSKQTSVNIDITFISYSTFCRVIWKVWCMRSLLNPIWTWLHES